MPLTLVGGNWWVNVWMDVGEGWWALGVRLVVVGGVGCGPVGWSAGWLDPGRARLGGGKKARLRPGARLDPNAPLDPCGLVIILLAA